MVLRTRWLIGLPLMAAGCALGALHAFAPLYLLHQGFPLDDAWIHAVYAREFARTGMLAYNPGVPATGETAPLWALLLAMVHRMAGGPASAVALTKAVGFTLHVLSAVLIALAVRPAADKAEPLVWVAGGFVAFHPHLVAASVSGMEVPLATLLMAGLVATTVRVRPVLVSMLGAAAFLGRPETAAFAVVFPLLFWLRARPRLALGLAGAACGGALASLCVLGIRDEMVSGRLLPATFYAKASVASPIDLAWQLAGFRSLLGQVPLVDAFTVIAALAVASMVLLRRRATSPIGRVAAAMYLSGMAFCAVSFALVHPIDPAAFYHQRYILPALLPIVAGLPLLAYEILGELRPRAGLVGRAVVLVLMASVLLQSTPSRYRRLANDARNIDDVQVAFGEALAAASPSENAWVVDAGAARFFGRPFVVDLLGLNTPELLTSRAQSFLDDHRPRYLDVFPGWSQIDGDGVAAMPVRSFETSTAYTVTSFPSMHQHVLVSCEPAGVFGRLAVRGRAFTFHCGQR